MFVNILSLSLRRAAALILLAGLSLSSFVSPVMAEDETGLCPAGFTEGVVTTGFVDCYRVTSSSSDREFVELLRLQREAECLAEPRSELVFSEVLVNSSGRFFGSLVCRINRVVPAGTLLCPDNTTEVFRAFDTLGCEIFGSAASDLEAANDALSEDRAICTGAPGGRVLVSSVLLGLSADDFEPFFFTDLTCGFDIPATDVFECPPGFFERSRNEDLLRCTREDRGLTSEAEGNRVNGEVNAMCSNTTAGLGEVTFSEVQFDTSGNLTFNSFVDCDISLPRFGDFVDGDIVRACDATCTLDIEQTRPCLNGGVVGGPGCTTGATQLVTRRCNTGIDKDGLCPLKGVPAANIVPLLLLDEEDED